MLLIVLNWLYIALVTFPVGYFILKLFSKFEIFSTKDSLIWRLVLAFWLGLALISSISICWSFFLPIGETINLILIASSVGIYWIHFGKIRSTFIKVCQEINNWSIVSKAVIVLLFIDVIIWSTSKFTYLADDGYYYLQTIKWLQSYKTVIGLGNLYSHLALGASQSWYVLQTVFSLPFLVSNAFDDLNGIFMLVSSLLLVASLDKVIKKQFQPYDLINVGLLCLFPLFHDSLKTMAADLPITILLFVFQYQLLKKLIDEDNKSGWFIVLTIMAAYMVTVKISCIVVVFLLLGFSLWENRKNVNVPVLTIAIVGGAFVAIPWLIRNILISGYLVYPLYYLDFFNFDWELPRSIAIGEIDGIKDWPKIKALVSNKLSPDFKDKPFWYWFKPWVKSLSLGYFALCFIVVVNTLALPVIYARYKSLVKKYTVPYLICYAGICFWFLQSPNMRFSLGLMTFYTCMTISLYYQIFEIYFKVNVGKLVSTLTLASVLLTCSFTVFKHRKSIGDYLIDQSVYPVPAYEVIKIKDVVVNKTLSPDNQCWNCPLPCTYVQNMNIELRGNTILDGLRPVGEADIYTIPSSTK